MNDDHAPVEQPEALHADARHQNRPRPPLDLVDPAAASSANLRDRLYHSRTTQAPAALPEPDAVSYTRAGND